MKSIFIRAICVMAIAALCLSLSACRGDIPDHPAPIITEDEVIPSITPLPGETYHVGELYGSYLTMYFGYTPVENLELPLVKVFSSYADVEDYYDSTSSDFHYGARFTSAMASFTDEFLAKNDVMTVAINEPSSYLNHTAEPIEITDSEIRLNITRHISQNAPRSDTQYHLIFTAPKGAFAGIDEKSLEVNITEVVDIENNSAFDAERYRLYYPEFWNFCYRADALTDDPQLLVDVIDGYDDLVFFLNSHRGEFDLDSVFSEYVGTLYNWYICERYILIATVIPCAEIAEPRTSELFVNNLEIYLTLDATPPPEGAPPSACYLLLTAIERSDLQGVNLDFVYLG